MYLFMYFYVALNCLLASGVLLSWGWNEHGMCGDGTETDVKGPKPISKLKSMKIIEFGTGYGHSFAFYEQ